MHRPQSTFAMSLFVWFLLIVLGWIHYFVYFSLTRFLDISERENFYLATILWFLSLTFLTSTVCASYWDNRKTRYAYYLSAIWLGILQYLFLSFLFIWGLAFITEWTRFTIPLDLLGTMGLGISIATVLYGISNARIISMTRVDVEIRNLPEAWEGKKIAHISDVHVGHILRAGFVRRIVRRINKENVEMVCITGDLFDGMDGRLEHLVDPLSDLNSPHGVFYVDGNHETYLGVERAFESLWHTKTKILRDEIVTLDGLDIIGIDYPEPWVRKDLAETIINLPAFKKENPSILLYHTPFQIDSIAKTGVDLELCGHTHKWQLFPFGIITYFLFRGRDYGLTRIGDYSLYTSSGVGTWWPPMRVGSKSEIVIITLKRKI